MNAIAGSFAVILALYSGVKIGYQSTILAAVLLYCFAGLLINRAQRVLRAAVSTPAEAENLAVDASAKVA